MATVTIELPDDRLADITQCYCEINNYKPQVDNSQFDANDPASQPLIDNPEIPRDFATRMFFDIIKSTVRDWKVNKLNRITRDTVEKEIAEVNPVLTIK